jgi:hypothetical protein
MPYVVSLSFTGKCGISSLLSSFEIFFKLIFDLKTGTFEAVAYIVLTSYFGFLVRQEKLLFLGCIAN